MRICACLGAFFIGIYHLSLPSLNMEKIHTISAPDCHVSHVIIKVEWTEKQMITLENTYFTHAEYIYLKTN